MKKKSMKWILFYYNSLPEMPTGCSVFSNKIVHRDFFKCRPGNTGHYEYPLFENFSYDQGCHYKEVGNFLKIPGDDKYVIFYTRHVNLHNNHNNIIVGYFKIGKVYTCNCKKDNARQGFVSSESVLLGTNEAITIDYKSRGVPVSWGRSSIKTFVDETLEYLIGIKKTDSNLYEEYQHETKKVMNLINKCKIIKICNSCNHASRCFWGRQRNKEKFIQEHY